MKLFFLICSTVFPADEQVDVTPEKFQIRSKIQLRESFDPLTGEIETKIKNEIRKLICDSPQLSLDNYEDCRLVSADFADTEQTEDGFSGYAQFLAEMTFEEGTVSKKHLLNHYEEKTKEIKATTTESPSVTSTQEPTSTTNPDDGSGDGSGDEPEDYKILQDFIGTEILIAELVKSEDEPPESFNFEYILPESLEPKSFVVCVGECKREGIWMMTAFVTISCFCLILSGFSFLCSNTGRHSMAVANSLVLLGLASTIIYFGVTEKVAWKFAGGYLGGTFGVLVGVLVLGFIPIRTKKVAQDDIELYWRSLKHRESQATTNHARL